VLEYISRSKHAHNTHAEKNLHRANTGFIMHAVYLAEKAGSRRKKETL